MHIACPLLFNMHPINIQCSDLHAIDDIDHITVFIWFIANIVILLLLMLP